MFSPYLTNISITTYVGLLKPNSNNAGWSVDTKKYHICHSWSMWNLNLGLMFRSYFDDFNHNRIIIIIVEINRFPGFFLDPTGYL